MCIIFDHLGKNCPNRTNNLQSAQFYLQCLSSPMGPLLLSLNTPKYQFPYIYSKQTTGSDAAVNDWDEIATKLNEVAKENRLIKQTVHKTHNTAAGMLGKSKSKTLVTNPRINTKKQTNPDSKVIKFNLRDHDSKSMTTPSQKVKSTKPVLKANTKTMTNDQQSVTMISKETESWEDTETDHVYDHSSHQGLNVDFLFPDLSSESDSDEEDSLFGTE